MERAQSKNGQADGHPRRPRYSFKQAETPQEFNAIHGLLYRTFVIEIPRYEDPGTDFLVDKFHDRNRYFIALRANKVCGMIAVHDQPPFSVMGAIQETDTLDRLGSQLLEARILAVEPRERFGIVFAGLAASVFDYAKRNAYRHIVITGLAKRQSMYERMGFRALGPTVERGQDRFVPMAFDLSSIPAPVQRDLQRWHRRQLNEPCDDD